MNSKQRVHQTQQTRIGRSPVSLWRRLDWVWLTLVGGSLLTAWLGEHPSPAGLRRMVVVAVLMLSAVKGLLIALSYMELHHAPPLWRRLVVGWLVLVLSAIAVISLWS